MASGSFTWINFFRCKNSFFSSTETNDDGVVMVTLFVAVSAVQVRPLLSWQVQGCSGSSTRPHGDPLPAARNMLRSPLCLLRTWHSMTPWHKNTPTQQPPVGCFTPIASSGIVQTCPNHQVYEMQPAKPSGHPRCPLCLSQLRAVAVCCSAPARAVHDVDASLEKMHRRPEHPLGASS